MMLNRLMAGAFYALAYGVAQSCYHSSVCVRVSQNELSQLESSVVARR
jgi:hypothetical protein